MNIEAFDLYGYLWYWTAWVNEPGLVNFRKDIYTRDKVLEKALRESFSSPKARINPP